MASDTRADARRRPPEGPFKSTNEAAAYLGISRRTLYRLMEANLIAWTPVGHRRRIALAELERYARRNRRGVA